MELYIILVFIIFQERKCFAQAKMYSEITHVDKEDTRIQLYNSSIEYDDTDDFHHDDPVSKDVLPKARGYSYYGIKNERQTAKGTKCQFPFMFRGVTFIDCAPGIHQRDPWCATIVNDSTNSEMEDWEVCAHDDRTDDETCEHFEVTSCVKPAIADMCPLMCSKGIGAIQPSKYQLTIKGTRCVFPFIHRGVPHSTCAPGVHLSSRWCATSTGRNGEYKEWEICAPTAEELASFNRFGMNDEAMKKFVDSLQSSADYAQSCLKEVNEIEQKIVTIEVGIEDLKPREKEVDNTPKYRSCDEHSKVGSIRKDIEKIKIFQRRRYHDDNYKEVLCNNEFDGGRWTIIQMRKDVHPRTKFQRPWHDYVEGFGDLDKEFWIGLDTINILTNYHNHELHISLEDSSGGRRIARYTTFRVGTASEKYKLTVSGYSGDAGDSLSNCNQRFFSTYDRDNDNSGHNCADRHKGGWWFYNCGYSNLNGLPHGSGQTGIWWYHWKSNSGLLTSTMMIRPR